jgi:hypothetical protein
VKERVKNVLNFKRSSQVVVIAAVLLAAVLGARFAVSQANSGGADFDLANFQVNGLQLGMDIDQVDTSGFEPILPLGLKDGGGYQYNYAEARIGVDPETGRLIKLHVVIDGDGAYIPTALRTDGSGTGYIPYNLKTIDQVTKFFGEGASGWYDREQNLRYMKYAQKQGRLAAIVTFVFHVEAGIPWPLIWVEAESNLPYPETVAEPASALSALKIP